VGARFSARPDRPWGPPSLPYNGYRVLPGGKERRGRDADTSPLLVPWSRKSRFTPLLSHGPYDLYRASVPVQGCTLPYFLQIEHNGKRSNKQNTYYNSQLLCPYIFIMAHISTQFRAVQLALCNTKSQQSSNAGLSHFAGC